MKWRVARSDALYLVDTLMPGTGDREQAADLIRGDDGIIEAMLDEERLFRRLMDGEEIWLQASPWLLFTVLLRRTRRELELQPFTVERRNRQKVLLFDTDRVIGVLAQDEVLSYLATTLASFTRTRTVAVPVWRGEAVRWHRRSDLNVLSLMRHCAAIGEESRFESYRRIGDVCLFLTGMFPEHIEAQCRKPASGGVRRQAKDRILSRLEDYEARGRAFYRLAAEHETARAGEIDTVLRTLSDNFVLAEKALTFLATRHLRFTKQALFGQ